MKKVFFSRRLLLSIVIVFAVCATITYELRYVNRLQREISDKEMLLQSVSLLPGYACGVLDDTYVTDKLGANADRQYSRTASYVMIQGKRLARTQDSCRYVVRSDTARYIELFIDHIPEAEGLEEDYLRSLYPTVSEPRAVKLQQYPDKKIYYDAGVIYLVEKNLITRISVGTTSPSDAESVGVSILAEKIL